MASQQDVRRIALSLPGVREGEGRFAFSIEHKGKPKGFVWSWAERLQPQEAARGAVPGPGRHAAQRTGSSDPAQRAPLTVSVLSPSSTHSFRSE